MEIKFNISDKREKDLRKRAKDEWLSPVDYVKRLIAVDSRIKG